MKQKKSIDDLIKHMEEKGITFNYVSKDEAAEFIINNNFYFKISSYRFNFEKYQPNSSKAGKYISLDFGHLKELSTLDYHIRCHLLQMSIDIEHYIKVRLMAKIAEDPNEDGYHIVEQFFKKEDPDSRILKSIDRHKSGRYCKDLITKYYPAFPVWVFLELISFGQLIHFCKFYADYTGQNILSDINNKFLNTVRDIRNACAHSNCLLNTIPSSLPKTRQADTRIRNFVLQNACNPEITKSSQGKYLNNELTYNLLTVLYVYFKLVPEVARAKKIKELSVFFHGRMRKNEKYFVSQEKLTSMYKFWVSLIDNLVANT